MQLMKKINKEFDERCLKIRNRIQRIKNEEKIYEKQMINFRKKEIQDKLIKEDKKKLKIEIEKNKEERNKALNSKKKLIQSQREKDSIYRQNKKNENLSQKKLNYQTSLNDKYLMKIIKEQLNNQQMNKNTCNHAKIKQELNEFETNKMKRNLEKENQIQQMHENNIMQLKILEKEMKSTCNQLEELEREAIESLNKTKHMKLKIIGENPQMYYNGGSMKKKKSKNNKQINKSMENIKIKSMDEKTINKEDNNPNRSVYIKKNRNRYMSPKSKIEKENTKIKSKTKYGNSISINSFPKTNKSKSTEKIIYRHKTSSIGKNNYNKKDIKDKETNKTKEKEGKKSKKDNPKNNKNNVNKK